MSKHGIARSPVVQTLCRVDILIHRNLEADCRIVILGPQAATLEQLANLGQAEMLLGLDAQLRLARTVVTNAAGSRMGGRGRSREQGQGVAPSPRCATARSERCSKQPLASS